MQFKKDDEFVHSEIASMDKVPDVIKKQIGTGQANNMVLASLKQGQQVKFMGLECVVARLQSKKKIITLRML